MSETEVISIEVETSQVPAIIQKQFDALKTLSENVSLSTEKAEKAKQSACSAKEKSFKAFHKKEAVESLQSATVDLADAQISAAQAHEISFEYQQKLAEMTKYLFALGVSNISMNRSVVRELELKLKGASKDELDELARKEIITVVKQLKAQEDILTKQNELSQKVKAHEIQLQEKTVKDDTQDEEIARQVAVGKELGKRIDARVKRDEAQDAEMARQAAIDLELGERIEAGDKRDEVQDTEIARQASVDTEHDRLINELIATNAEKDKQINALKEICENLASQILDNTSVVDNKERNLIERIDGKADKKMVIMAYVIGVVGLIAALLQFFI